MGCSATIVGRDREIAEVLDAFADSTEGRVRVALIAGDPGIGKTRLADEVAGRLPLNARRLRVRCDAMSAGELLGPWQAAIRSAGEDVAAGPGEAVTTLAGLASSRPLVIVIDDLDRADEMSWALLDRLSGIETKRGILVLATVGELRLGDRPVGLRVTADLERRGVLRRIELGPLDENAVLELARVHRDGDVPFRVAGQLHERSGGNAFFVNALLDEMDGDPDPEPDRLLPRAVVADVRARVAEAGEDAVRLLQGIAAAGGALDLAVLPEIAAKPGDDLALVLRRLVDADLIEEVRAGDRCSYRIHHPMVMATIGLDVGPARRLAVARQVGRAHLQAGRHGDAARQLSSTVHGVDADSIELLIDALATVDDRGGYADGIALLGALGSTMPRGSTDWIAVAGSLHNWMGDHRVDCDRPGAIEALRKIDALPADCVDDHQRAVVNACMVTLLAYGTGELLQATEAARRAIRLFECEGSESDVLLARLELAYVGALRGDEPGWRDAVEEVIARAEELEDVGVLEAALGARGLSCLLNGDLAEAENAFERAIELAWRIDKTGDVVHHGLRLGWTLGYSGRIEEALTALERAKAADAQWMESSVLEIEAYVRWLSGDLRGVRSLESEFAGVQLTLRRGVGWSMVALADAEADQMDAARAAIEQARKVYSRGTWFYATDLFHHACGVVAWREGDHASALALMKRASSHLMQIGVRTIAAPILLDRAELAAELGESEELSGAVGQLSEIALASQSPLFSGISELARARLLLSEGERLAASIAAREAAALLDTGGYALLHGRALVVLAETREDRDEVVDLLGKAAGIFNRTGAAWRRGDALDRLGRLGDEGRAAASTALGPDGLTPREWEVIELAAKRLSAQQIADRLILSRRTIESHFASAYRKLEVHSRSELLTRLASSAAASTEHQDGG